MYRTRLGEVRTTLMHPPVTSRRMTVLVSPNAMPSSLDSIRWVTDPPASILDRILRA